MSTICAGRVKFLEKEIVKAIRVARAVDYLNDGSLGHIFDKLLEDPTIKQRLDESTDKH